MAREITKGLDNISREFFEFVTPAIDMVKEGNELVVTIDLPGFAKKNIDLDIAGNVLTINARRMPEDTKGTVYYRHRPLNINKKVLLPISIEEKGPAGKATYEEGVLTLRVPITSSTVIPIS